MTKIFDIIPLNNHLYMVDREAKISRNDWFFVKGQGHQKWQQISMQALDFKDTGKSIITQTNHAFNYGNCIKILASNNASLKLPLLPEIEEDVPELAKNYAKNSNWGSSKNKPDDGFVIQDFLAGYKAAKSKRYTKEDMKNAMKEILKAGIYGRWPEEEAFNKIIQSLNPIPKQVEVEWEYTHADRAPNGIDCGVAIENNFVKIIRWIYE